jgi:tetratricopeptide (TPR) repeat protein
VANVALKALTPGAGLDCARISQWLDHHDEVLDLRSLWLARASLSRLTGRDSLGLARARDRVLAKLHRGLSVDRDVPSFLRFLGGARDPRQIELLGAHIASLARRYETTRRAASTVEADPKLTLAYVLYAIGYGCARVGQSEVARAHARRAGGLVDDTDPIHGFLARAYAARIEQAIEALPVETPLDPTIDARLNALDKFSRYKVDRVRQFSQVLEPQERLDPVAAFQRGLADPRGAEFTDLRGLSNVAALEEGIDRIFAQARTSTPEERARLFDGVMDFFPAIGIERAHRYLEEVVDSLADIAPPRQAQLLEEALMLAGHVGSQELTRKIFASLRSIVLGLEADALAEVAPVMGGMLRTLRRVGLRSEASEIVATMQRSSSGQSTPARVARLHCAASLAYLGHFDEARPAFEEALAFLAGDLPISTRLPLTRTFARAVGQAPLEYALASLDRLAEKLPVITDSFNTNSHVCLSVLAFMESLVLGYASEDLTMGELGRQWLDDDEYLLRRRVHRDMAST